MEIYEYLLVRLRRLRRLPRALRFKGPSTHFLLAERGRRPVHPLQRFRSLPGPGPPQPHPHVRGRAGGAWAWTALYSMSWADCSLLRCATVCGRWRRSTRTCPRCVYGQLVDGRGALSAPPSQMPEPHEDIGCWWTIYDYGLDTVKTWKKGCVTAAVRLRASMLAVLTVPPFAQLQAPLPRGAVAQARGGRLPRRQGGPPRAPRRQSERRCGAWSPRRQSERAPPAAAPPASAYSS